jgi:hypothetical protein
MIHRAADPAPAASGVARPPMSLDELDRWLRAPRQRKPAADGIAMLDGFVAAIASPGQPPTSRSAGSARCSA